MPATASTKGMHIEATRVATREKRVTRPGVQKTRSTAAKVKDVLKPGRPGLPKRKKTGNYTTKSPEKNKYWIFTLFAGKNPDGTYKDFSTLDNYVWPDATLCSYLVYGKETCPDTGRLHYQGYIEFINRQSASAVRGYLPGARNAVRRGTGVEASMYCKEDGDFVEIGTLALPTGVAGSKQAKKNFDAARESAKRGDFDEIPGNIAVPYYGNLKRIWQDNPIMPDKLAKPCGEWFWGPPGCGKSDTAVDENPGYYPKSHNKWWNGYKGEDVVIFDDLSPHHLTWITDFLKQWTHHLPFTTEEKGSGNVIRPKRFIVTSNYSIAELWGHGDQAEYQAIKRRFRLVRHFTHCYTNNEDDEIEYITEPLRSRRDVSMALPAIVSPIQPPVQALVVKQEIPSPIVLMSALPWDIIDLTSDSEEEVILAPVRGYFNQMPRNNK